MDINLLTAIIGILAGAFGYWFTTFSMQPILRYRNIRSKVLADFIYFAQVVDAEGLNEEMQVLFQERVLANRKSSADLSAAIEELPYWYLQYLKLKKLSPQKAASKLIGYSNNTDYDQAHELEVFIRKNLGLPDET